MSRPENPSKNGSFVSNGIFKRFLSGRQYRYKTTYFVLGSCSLGISLLDTNSNFLFKIEAQFSWNSRLEEVDSNLSEFLGSKTTFQNNITHGVWVASQSNFPAKVLVQYPKGDMRVLKMGMVWLVIPIFTFYYNWKGRNGYDFSFHVNSLQNTCEAKFPFRPLFCSRLIR